MRVTHALCLCLTLGGLLSVPLRAEDDMEFLFGQKAKPFIDPRGFYAVIFPSGFDCKAKARHVECSGTREGKALLTIDVLDTPPSASADLVLLNQMERFQKKPHFKLIANEKTKIDGTPAVVASFSYDYLGNVEYSVGVQALYLVRQSKTYVIHFEARLNQFKNYRKDLEAVYGSFRPARLDAAGNPILEDLKPQQANDPNQLQDVDRALKSGF